VSRIVSAKLWQGSSASNHRLMPGFLKPGVTHESRVTSDLREDSVLETSCPGVNSGLLAES